MELVTYDNDTVTIRMNRKTEFTRLSRLVSAAAIDPNKLDREITMLTDAQLSQLEDELQVVSTVLRKR